MKQSLVSKQINESETYSRLRAAAALRFVATVKFCLLSLAGFAASAPSAVPLLVFCTLSFTIIRQTDRQFKKRIRGKSRDRFRGKMCILETYVFQPSNFVK